MDTLDIIYLINSKPHAISSFKFYSRYGMVLGQIVVQNHLTLYKCLTPMVESLNTSIKCSNNIFFRFSTDPCSLQQV